MSNSLARRLLAALAALPALARLAAPSAAQGVCPEEPALAVWTGAGQVACPCFVQGEKVVDYAQAPFNAGPGAIAAGSTWNVQFGYRDVPAGMSGFNLSNGLSPTFTP